MTICSVRIPGVLARLPGRSLPWLAALVLAGCASQAPLTTPEPPPAPTAATPALVDTPALTLATRTLSDEGFQRWVQAFRADAQAQGISEATLRSTLDPVRLQSRIIQNDRNQSEYVRPVWAYLDTAVSAQRIRMGRSRLTELQTAGVFGSDAARVPDAILVAIWGMETSYGSHLGSMRVMDALATLAYEGRREAWARGELLAALRLVEQGEVSAEQLVGSWAGAMGQTQFMPSTYLAHAVDGDGDGRRDLWGSVPDALASTAHYLRQSGWRADEPCLTEVVLPPGFDPALAESDIRRPSAAWAEAGVRPIDPASPMPTLQAASLLLPAGLQGPAFMVGDNFRAVLRYNMANSYALAVCLLARHMEGAPGVQTAWPRHQQLLTRQDIITVQATLNRLGFQAGEPDGVAGPATRRALRAWQRTQGLPADGFVSAEVLARMGLSGAEAVR